MKWYVNNWFYVGAILFVIQAFLMILFGTDIDPLKRFMIVSFMALNVHQFEEYALPGGFPMVMNMAFMGECEHPERYPLNKKSAFVCNVCLVYPVYILGIIFSNVMWVVIAIVLFGAAQFFVHGIAFNKKMKSIYNPGMGSVVFLFIPLAIYVCIFVVQNYTVTVWDWVIALALQPVVGLLGLLVPIRALQDKNSSHPFPKEETEKFHVREKMAKLKG